MSREDEDYSTEEIFEEDRRWYESACTQKLIKMILKNQENMALELRGLCRGLGTSSSSPEQVANTAGKVDAFALALLLVESFRHETEEK